MARSTLLNPEEAGHGNQVAFGRLISRMSKLARCSCLHNDNREVVQ